MRFRNRFKCEQMGIRECPDCGLRIAVSVADGRETQIHEFPLCEPFKAWCAVVTALPDGRAHGLSAVMVDDAETLGNPEIVHFNAEEN